MKTTTFATGLIALTVALAGCSREPDALQIPTGSDVTVEKRDGVTVAGRLIEVQPREVVLESSNGQKTRVARAEIKSVRAAESQPPAPAATTSNGPPPPVGQTATDRSDTTRGQSKSAPESAATPVEKPAARAPRYREVTIPAGTVLPVELKTT